MPTRGEGSRRTPSSPDAPIAPPAENPPTAPVASRTIAPSGIVHTAADEEET